MRRIINTEESTHTKLKEKKEELLSMKLNSVNSEKMIETTKGLVTQKKVMLQKMQQEVQGTDSRRKEYE